MRTRRLIPLFAALLLILVGGGIAVYFSLRDDAGAGDEEDVRPEWGFRAGPSAWSDAEPQRDGRLGADGTLGIGSLAVPPPLPDGVDELSWETTPRTSTASGTFHNSDFRATVRTARHNSSVAFAAQTELTPDRWSEAIVSELRLPLGEVSYVNPSYEVVAFAGTEVVLPSMASGPITWRNGDVEMHLWQWRVDRVALRPGEDGQTIVEFTWWAPEQHAIPEECVAELGDVAIPIEVRGMITFGPLPALAWSRLPDGVASAVVPVFHDPRGHADARFKDALSTGASDFARRARTLALGHSSTKDARHGNGGLIGAGSGGTILVPHEWAGATAMQPLEEELAETTVQLVDDADVRPPDCGAWKAAVAETRPVIGPTEEFDGRFPNLMGRRSGELPSVHTPPVVWPATQLTGRRNDVVQQAMSTTYLDRLAERRGLAVLMVPIVASRNPLVAVAAESLLEPESNGHWTIQEQLARAFAGIELLAEEDHVELLALDEVTDYQLHSRAIEIHPRADGSFTVANPTDNAVRGFTLVVDGAVHPLVDGQAPHHAVREVGGGTKQTWLWWDVAANAEQNLRLEGPEASSPLAVKWSRPGNMK